MKEASLSFGRVKRQRAPLGLPEPPDPGGLKAAPFRESVPAESPSRPSVLEMMQSYREWWNLPRSRPKSS